VTAVGAVHTLIVRDIGEPDSELCTSEFKDYEIVHPADDPEPSEENGLYYRCSIDFNIDNAGLRFSLKYTGTPITEPGVYQIQAWAETIHGFDYTEYDGGIGLVPVQP
jgi:hypothetical protein